MQSLAFLSKSLAKSIIRNHSIKSQYLCVPVITVHQRTLFSTVTALNSSPSVAASQPISLESRIRSKLSNELDIQLSEGDRINLQDTSGGCGQFFRLEVISRKFDNLSLVKQHRLVNSIIKAEVGEIHGLTINTLSPQAAKQRLETNNPQ
jgi:stress-induced morphogen